MMARFLLYVGDEVCADQRGLSRLEAAGLSHLAPGATFLNTLYGPDHIGGVVTSWPAAGQLRTDFLPHLQTWTRSATGLYWVGFTNDGPPGPKDLAYRNQIKGLDVVLGDGRAWQIPSACNVFVEGTEPTESQRAFHTLAAEWLERLANPRASYTVAELWQIFCLALSQNYMITPEVVSRMNLLASRCVPHFLQVIVNGLEPEATKAERAASVPEVAGCFLDD